MLFRKAWSFKEWFLVENTVSQLAKTDPQIKQELLNLQLPPGFQSLQPADQQNLKKWLAYQLVKKDPQIMSKIGNMHVLLDPTDRFQVRKKLNRLDYDFNALSKDNEVYHQAMQTVQQRVYNKPVRVLENLPPINGLRWVSLDKGYCDTYGKSMGHCGNVAQKEGDNILSLMDNKNQHYLTFIVNKHVLGEMKAQHNQKPPAKFHPNIIQLLLSPYVEVIKGLGYKPGNNFQLSDLTPQEQQQVLAAKPNIDNYVGHINAGRNLKRSWYREDGHLIFDKNMDDGDFTELARSFIRDDEVDPTGHVSLAGEFIRRGLNIPPALITKIKSNPESAYLYAVQYLDPKNTPEDIIYGISRDAEYAASYAAEILKGENVPEVLMRTIMYNRGGLSDYIYYLIEHNYPVDQKIWDSLHNKTEEVERLLGFNWSNGIPDKIYDYIDPQMALYLIVAQNDTLGQNKRILDIAQKADIHTISQMLAGTHGHKVPESLVKRVALESDNPYAIKNAFKILLDDRDFASKMDETPWVQEAFTKASQKPDVAWDLIHKIRHREGLYGFRIKVPEVLFKSIAESGFLNDFLYSSAVNNWPIPDFMWDHADKYTANYLLQNLKNRSFSNKVIEKIRELQKKFDLIEQP